MKKILSIVFVSAVALSSFASAALTPPAADYADIYTMAAYILGILVTVYLVKKAINFVKA